MFLLITWKIKVREIFTTVVKFAIITERYVTVIIHNLGHFDAHPASFQIQNGGYVIREYADSDSYCKPTLA